MRVAARARSRSAVFVVNAVGDRPRGRACWSRAPSSIPPAHRFPEPPSSWCPARGSSPKPSAAPDGRFRLSPTSPRGLYELRVTLAGFRQSIVKVAVGDETPAPLIVKMLDRQRQRESRSRRQRHPRSPPRQPQHREPSMELRPVVRFRCPPSAVPRGAAGTASRRRRNPTPNRTPPSTRTNSAGLPSSRSRPSRSTSTPRPTRTSADSSMKAACRPQTPCASKN